MQFWWGRAQGACARSMPARRALSLAHARSSPLPHCRVARHARAARSRPRTAGTAPARLQGWVGEVRGVVHGQHGARHTILDTSCSLLMACSSGSAVVCGRRSCADNAAAAAARAVAAGLACVAAALAAGGAAPAALRFRSAGGCTLSGRSGCSRLQHTGEWGERRALVSSEQKARLAGERMARTCAAELPQPVQGARGTTPSVGTFLQCASKTWRPVLC